MAQRGLSRGVIAMIVVDAILVVVLIALLITHPRPEGEPEPTPTEPAATAEDEAEPEETEPEPEPEEAEPALQPPDDAVSEAAFVTPSGNIWCQIDGDSASCTIGSHSYSLPDQPDCDGPYGRVLQVTEDEATLPCLSEEPATSAPDGLAELDYGESTVVNDFWCTSEETGMTCYSVMSGRGFSVARADYSLF